MAILGVIKTFDKKFSFRFEIDGFSDGDFAFTKVSGLEVEVGEIKQWEGGALIPNRSAGRLDFKPITLERGATSSRAMLAWFAMVALQPLSLDPTYKRNGRLAQLDRGTGRPNKAWTIVGLWPTNFVAGEWDNTVDENVIEKMTLVYDFFFRTL